MMICFFAFISNLVVISYTITYNTPDYFGIEGWYSLLNNISISYIAAFIFFKYISRKEITVTAPKQF